MKIEVVDFGDRKAIVSINLSKYVVNSSIIEKSIDEVIKENRNCYIRKSKKLDQSLWTEGICNFRLNKWFIVDEINSESCDGVDSKSKFVRKVAISQIFKKRII